MIGLTLNRKLQALRGGLTPRRAPGHVAIQR